MSFCLAEPFDLLFCIFSNPKSPHMPNLKPIKKTEKKRKKEPPNQLGGYDWAIQLLLTLSAVLAAS